MCGSCLLYPERQAIICQFRRIIGGARSYKICGGLAPAGPPVPTPMLYFVRSNRHQSEL